MTVGELRKALEGLDDAMSVVVETTNDDGDLLQAKLISADVEIRCDEVEALYIYADAGTATIGGYS